MGKYTIILIVTAGILLGFLTGVYLYRINQVETKKLAEINQEEINQILNNNLEEIKVNVKDNYQEKVVDQLTHFNKKSSWKNPYSWIYNSQLKIDVTMRNDLGKNNKTRELFTVTSHDQMVDKIKSDYKNYGSILHGRWVDKGYFGDEIILTPKSGFKIAENATKENPANIILTLQMGPQFLVSLYGENDKLLTQDCHMYHNYSLSSRWYERKMERSYYVNEEVKKITIESIGDVKISKDMNVSMFDLDDVEVKYRYYDEFKQDWAFAKENALQNIENTTNSFSFDTNYGAQKIVCLNVPYDQGWTLKMDNEEVDIISMNGGFIGFIAPSGEHSYYLSYLTPGISDGLKLTLGGLGLGIVTFVGYNFHYCITVSKSVVDSTILVKRKKEEEEAKNKAKEKESKKIKLDPEKIEKSTNRVINVITALLSAGTGLLIANLFASLGFMLNLLGFVLGYILSSIIAYFVSVFFKKIVLDKKSIIKYIKIASIGLLIGLVIYLILSAINIYVSFKYTVSFILTMPILYVLYKKLISKKRTPN